MSTSAKRPAVMAGTAPPTVLRLTLGVILAIIVTVVAATQLGSSSGAVTSGPAPADVLPAGFPVPADAQVVGQGAGEPGAGVITMTVPGTAADVVAFYTDQLPSAGWTTEPWEGTNPYGQATSGLVLRQDGKEGALSATDGEDGRVLVQINLNQPVSPTEGGHSMSGMSGGGS